MFSFRRGLVTSAALVSAALFTLTGCASGSEVAPTGETTEVTVTVQGMHFVPDVVEVPVGNELIITFENTSFDMHDLVFANGVSSGHLAPGEAEVMDVGLISGDVDGWCSLSNHRELGMEILVRAIG